MTKQTYYGCISAVHYSGGEDSHINRVKVYEVSKDKIKRNGIIDDDLKKKKPRRLTVDKVIDEMKKGKYFMTMFKKDGQWVKGRRVGKVKTFIIRSHPTITKPEPKDDLEDLPKF
jgi:hypothetical protein